MFAILISLLLASLVGVGLDYCDVASHGWSIFWGALTLLTAQASLGVVMRKKMQVVMTEIQSIMQSGQRRIQQKTENWKRRPPSSIKQAQQEIAKEHEGMVQQALTVVDGLKRYYPWVPLLSRQADTMKMQFYWQLKQFDQVDALLPRAMMADPMLMAIKLARSYQLKASPQEMEKIFKKFSKRLRYGKGELFYCLYAWILVKNNDINGALKVLATADEKMESKTVKHNRDLLVNNRPQHFSLAGLGDAWYALWLEEPKVRQQHMNQHQARRFF